jgi:hypothetical protein
MPSEGRKPVPTSDARAFLPFMDASIYQQQVVLVASSREKDFGDFGIRFSYADHCHSMVV